jgi:beta-catenin-like protein 1
MENIIDVLCSALAVRENKQIFEKEEGTELMCILMKSKGDARLRSVKVLNHAFSGVYGSANCTRFVDNQGLKALFGIFMGKVKHSSYVESSKQDEEHILEIFMSLLNNLKSESVERIRLINKFVEKEYEKVARLIEIRSNVRTRLRPIEEKIQEQKRNGDSIDEEEKEEMQLSFYLDRVDSGLFSLQLIDYILAWLIMEDDGIFQHIQMIFTRTDTSLDEVIDTLKEYHDNVGSDAIVALSEDYKGQEEEEDTGLTLKDVIVNLVNYLLSLL